MRARACGLALAAALSACGGGSPTGSTQATPSPFAYTLVSGETDAPVPGASLTVAGRTFTSDASGQAAIGERPPVGGLVDVVASGFLDRQTVVRSNLNTLVLWPRRSPTGLDEDFTAQVVYTNAGLDESAVGDAPLVRLRAGTSQAFVVLSGDLLADAAAVRAHENAAGQVGVATDGGLVYSVVDSRPASGVVFQARVDRNAPLCRERVRAYFDGRYSDDEIQGGELVYCSADVARSATVAHEVGHSVGLQHSPSTRDLMHGFFVRGRPASFSAREALALRLMLERRGGNRFPDNDRDVRVAGSRRRLIVCE